MSSEASFMKAALEEAGRALVEGEVPVGAVLVDGDGRVMARAHNRSIALSDPTAHAEILVLRQAAAGAGNYRLTGSTLYATVEPCVMCAGAMIWARVGRLFFGAPDPKGGAVETLYRILQDRRLNHNLEAVGGIMEEECRDMMRRFFEGRRSGEIPGPHPD